MGATSQLKDKIGSAQTGRRAEHKSNLGARGMRANSQRKGLIGSAPGVSIKTGHIRQPGFQTTKKTITAVASATRQATRTAGDGGVSELQHREPCPFRTVCSFGAQVQTCGT